MLKTREREGNYMRQILNLNRKWAFTKMANEVPTAIDNRWDFVNLPHTWNALDGMDGGGDYYRGTAWYAKEIDREDLPVADRYYIEFRGANASADLYVNGEKKMPHEITTACTGCGACAAKCPKKCITMKVREHARDRHAKVGTTPDPVLAVKNENVAAPAAKPARTPEMEAKIQAALAAKAAREAAAKQGDAMKDTETPVQTAEAEKAE